MDNTNIYYKGFIKNPIVKGGDNMKLTELKIAIKEAFQLAAEEGWDDNDILEYLENQGILEEIKKMKGE